MQKNENFLPSILSTKASAELEAEIEEELQKEDPELQKAKAILKYEDSQRND